MRTVPSQRDVHTSTHILEIAAILLDATQGEIQYRSWLCDFFIIRQEVFKHIPQVMSCFESSIGRRTNIRLRQVAACIGSIILGGTSSIVTCTAWEAKGTGLGKGGHGHSGVVRLCLGLQRSKVAGPDFMNHHPLFCLEPLNTCRNALRGDTSAPFPRRFPLQRALSPVDPLL